MTEAIVSRVLHLGFGKTATTTLQTYIYPKFAESLGVQYIPAEDPRIRRHSSRMNFGKPVDSRLDFPGPFFVSAEDLHGWDPFTWEERVRLNEEFFGPDCHVLLTLREPREYLSSVYLQMCISQGNIQRPDEFFLPSNLYSPHLASAKFSIDHFGYNRIIDLYASRFSAMTAVKYEAISDMSFLKELYPVTVEQLDEFREIYRTHRVNVSASERAVRATMAFQALIGRFGLCLIPNSILASLEYLALSRDLTPSSGELRPREPHQRWVARLGNYIMRRLTWRAVVRRLDLHWPGKKFMLDFDTLKQIRIDDLQREYSSLPPILTKRK